MTILTNNGNYIKMISITYASITITIMNLISCCIFQ